MHEQVDADVSNDSLEIILVRMEGKLDRMSDRMQHFERDIDGQRTRIHDIANMVSPIIMLDIPRRITDSDKHNAKIDARLEALENTEQQRKGAANLAKLVWGIGGMAGIGSIAAVLRVLQVGGF